MSIIVQIRKLVLHFLWVGKLNISKFHLSSWESIPKTKFLSGCWVKDLDMFNQSLCEKTLWRSLFNDGLWGNLVKLKYLKRCPIYFWFRNHVNLKSDGCLIWRSMMKVFPIISQSIHLSVGRGIQVFVGIDPIVELGKNFKLS